ncbi:7310_t:CDS:2, partial [Paraglomus occultum]
MRSPDTIAEVWPDMWPTHFACCLITRSGIILFTAGYAVSSGDLLALQLPAIYSSATHRNVEISKISLRSGMLIGQLIFGIVGDLYGRTRACNITLLLILFSTLSIACLGDGPGLQISSSLVIMRVIQGVGIGGSYPSTTLMVSEYAPTNKRPIMLAAIFLWYICGSFYANAVAAITQVKSDQIDSIWRFVVGFGLIPGVAAFGLLQLWKISETPVFRENHRQNRGVLLWGRDFLNYLCDNRKTYFAICGAWFAADAVAYGYRSDIRPSDINVNQDNTNMSGVLIDNVIRVFFGSVLGALATLVFISYLPRKVIMIVGFAASAILFAVFGFFPGKMGYISYLTLSTMIMFAQNFGPNALTFIVAAELWCTQYRSTSYGIASAYGRLGTITSYTIFRVFAIDSDKTFIGPLSLIIVM